MKKTEVDLEEEFYVYMEEVFDSKTNGKPTEEDMLEFARHFYKLGLKSKQW